MGDFDKIIKENMEAVFLPLAEKLLGIKIFSPVDLPEKLQSTIEREVDFIKKIKDEKGKEFILHLEFQTNDEPKMVYRMAEYKALIQRKWELPVIQFVIYFGTRKPTMRTQLDEHEQILGFNLRNIHDLPVDEVLESDVPEEIILSILSDYPKADSEKVIDRILTRLRIVSKDQTALKKNVNQLLMLSRLRKLDVKTEKQITKMPITYDIENDRLFKKGIIKGELRGEQRGILKGEQRGIEKAIFNTICKMLADPKYSFEEIAQVTDTAIEYVQQVKGELPMK